MARFVIDLRMVQGPLHGIARYALELARRIPPLAPAHQFLGLVGPDGLPDHLGPLEPSIPLLRCPAAFLSPLEQPALAASLLRARADVFHATSFSLPALWPGTLVATLHDATHLALAENRTLSRVGYYRAIVTPRARRAAAIITDSEFSRTEVARWMQLDAARIRVIHCGVEGAFCPQPAHLKTRFRELRGLPKDFVLAMGNPKPHKNLKILQQLAESKALPLVLLAGKGARRELGLPPHVIELSPMADDDLVLLYGCATATLVPSFYEGFGLPALESMACGTPVVAADAGALPEIVGSAGLLVPPHDPSAWCSAVESLAKDELLRRRLSELGLERSTRFGWDVTAVETWDAYRKALGPGVA